MSKCQFLLSEERRQRSRGEGHPQWNACGDLFPGHQTSTVLAIPHYGRLCPNRRQRRRSHPISGSEYPVRGSACGMAGVVTVFTLVSLSQKNEGLCAKSAIGA